jgi:DNA processing protein
MSDLKYWIALTEVQDVGPVTARKLLAVYKNPEAIFKASFNELSGIKGIGQKKAKDIKKYNSWAKIDKQFETLEKNHAHIITLKNSDYPELLKNLPDAPIILYARGTIIAEDKFAIAVVGSRKPTSYGQYAVEKLSSELSSAGFTIVSGLARGIDTLAHVSAVKSGGRTFGVLGSGIDVPYPPENKALMDKIANSGCVMSEFPPGTKPNKENFPRRNRLISGLSLGVLVVEATADSGSLITAGLAIDQGREVFAVPGNINSSNSGGTNQLIKQGAKTVQSANDIIEELAPVLKGFINMKQKSNIELSAEEKKLCDIMTAEPKHIDLLSRESGIFVSKALGILLSLELKGVVKQAEGKKFFLV